MEHYFKKIAKFWKEIGCYDKQILKIESYLLAEMQLVNDRDLKCRIKTVRNNATAT